MDYGKEVSGLKDVTRLDWFKPKTGQYTVKILSEPKEYEFRNKEGKVEKAMRIDIEVDNKDKMAWSFGKAETYASLYGQLMLIGSDRKKLEGNTINLLVKNDGKKNSYTVMEALPLIKQYQKPKVEEVK